MRQLFLWKRSYTITLYILISSSVVAIVFTLASNARVILGVQNYLGIPGGSFEIGDAIIEKQSKWLLLSSLEKNDSQFKFLGMLPSWPFFKKETRPRGEKIFLFQDMSDNQNTVISFSEIPPELNEKLKFFIQNVQTMNPTSLCVWKIRHLSNYDALECIPTTNNQDFDMYIPEFQVFINVRPYAPNFVNSLSIKRKSKRSPG